MMPTTTMLSRRGLQAAGTITSSSSPVETFATPLPAYALPNPPNRYMFDQTMSMLSFTMQADFFKAIKKARHGV
jgi:hypothetical protein